MGFVVVSLCIRKSFLGRTLHISRLKTYDNLSSDIGGVLAPISDGVQLFYKLTTAMPSLFELNIVISEVLKFR